MTLTRIYVCFYVRIQPVRAYMYMQMYVYTYMHVCVRARVCVCVCVSGWVSGVLGVRSAEGFGH